MVIYLDFESRKTAYGGANSFLTSLIHELQTMGFTFTRKAENADIIFINALTHDSQGTKLTENIVKDLYSKKYKQKVVKPKKGKGSFKRKKK